MCVTEKTTEYFLNFINVMLTQQSQPASEISRKKFKQPIASGMSIALTCSCFFEAHISYGITSESTHGGITS